MANCVQSLSQAATTLLLTLTTIGCAGSPFRTPAQGGAQWFVAHSPHFALYTTGTHEAIGSALETLEATHTFFTEVAFPSSDHPSGGTEVIVLPAAEFDALEEAYGVKWGRAGYFTTGHSWYGLSSRFVVRGALGEHATDILQHELTHRFVAHHCPGAPAWLNESLAEFWETLDIREDVTFFGGPVHVSVAPTPLHELLELYGGNFYDGDELQVAQNYFGARALGHVLYFEHRDLLGRYINVLKAGTQSPREAWAQVAGPTLTEVSRSYATFFQRSGTIARIATRPTSFEWTSRRVSDSETHLMWAGLWPRDGQHETQAMREIEKAVNADPGSSDALLSRALVLLGTSREAQALADVERALALAPHKADTLAGAIIFAAGSRRALSIPSLQLAERLLANNPQAAHLVLVADYYSRIDRTEEGITLASRAIELDSACARCYFVGANLLAQRGNVRSAVAAQRTGLALTGEHAPKAQVRRLRELETMLERQRTTSD